MLVEIVNVEATCGTCTHFVSCASKSIREEERHGERSAYSFALLMCFTFVWLSAQLIHGRGTGVGQSTGTNSGLVTALCLLAML